eukprot:1541320-Pleurochrysis_carterae.AAC.1
MMFAYERHGNHTKETERGTEGGRREERESKKAPTHSSVRERGKARGSQRAGCVRERERGGGRERMRE